MAWDSMDMWWMDKPERSNLPEIAVGAFMQGRAQAQRQAEFAAELPMKVAESNARTAANVAQMNIATKRAERDMAEWERTDREEPLLQDYSRQIATWYSDPLNKGEIPMTPNGLTGENLAKANKLMLDASIAKRVQVANSEVGMARAKEMEDTANLIASGYLDETKATDTEAKKLARINRASREAGTIAEKMGIRNMPMTNVPTLPNGNLDTVAWQYTLEQFKPKTTIPEGMVAETLTVTDAQGNKVTYKTPDKPKAGQTREEYARELAPKLLQQNPSLTPQEAAFQAGEMYDNAGKERPPVGTVPESPLTYQEKLNVPASGAYVKFPAGTKYQGQTYEEDTVRWVGPMSSDVKKQKLTERQAELQSKISTESGKGPITETVTPGQLAAEFFGGMADRTRASTFSAPQGTSAVRTRQRTPEDASRLKKMQDELTAIEQELKTLQK